MFYDQDLTHIHDVGFGRFAESAGSFMLRQLRAAKRTDGLVVDVGCGTGIWAARLAAAGYQVHGIDISAAMIKKSRAAVPTGKFVHGSMYDARLPDCCAVTCSGEIINYAVGGRVTWAMRRRFLRRVYQALIPGGIFALDFATLGRGGPDGDYERVFRGHDWLLVLKCSEDQKRRRLTRDMTGFVKAGRHYRRLEEIHRLDLLDAKQIIQELRTIGFRVRSLKQYEQMKFPPGYAALLAKK